MKKIAISIHAIEDFTLNIIKGLKGFDYIHVDVMDGKFVNSINNNLNVFHPLKETYNTPIIAHLMVINPFDYIKKIIKNIDIFLFHLEVLNNIRAIIEEIRKSKKKVGLAINPETKTSEIIPYLKEIDLVLVMSVNPGLSGQEFIPNSVKKVNKLAEFKKHYNFVIDVDGGINLINAKLLKNADILTSSSTILKAKDPNKILKLLKKSGEND
ncbi:MAG: ribulose-phosphate 3-epimerase [Promethearchaeota archaeon]